MTDYTKAVDFAAKDGQASGTATKTISGATLDAEFELIQTASATKANSSDIPAAIFASGDQLVFAGATPSGWTVLGTNANHAIRLNATIQTGGVIGGTVNFSTAFASQAINANTGNPTSSFTHTHGDSFATSASSNDHYNIQSGVVNDSAPNTVFDGTAHTHTVTGSVSTSSDLNHVHSYSDTINLAVKYQDMCVITKT